jgi:ribose-phosphate pyrophosphokinase
MPEIGKFVKKFKPDLIVSPDRGAVELAKTVSEVLDCQWDYLEKTRIDGKTVKMQPKNMEAEGKKVVIVDDIIATGGTIITATKQLRAQGAKKVYAACTHGLFTSRALPKLERACDGVYSTNTIPGKVSKISAAQPIADALEVLR